MYSTILTISTTIITVQVLQTIPWDKVDIEVLTVETNHAGEIFPGTKQEIREYLAEKGYVHAATVGKLTVLGFFDLKKVDIFWFVTS